MESSVRGCVAQVEPTEYHRSFVTNVEPARILLKLHHAANLVDRGFSAQSWAGSEPTVITTSTIQDERLDAISWSEERDVVEQFGPDYHIPSDVSIYPDQNMAERVDLIVNCMKGAAYMQSELAPTSTEIIPLLKGKTQKERNLCLKTATHLDAEQVAIYVAPYFASNQGNNRKQMFRELAQCQQHEMYDVLLIGLLSPAYLKQVPEFVTAASGQHQWRKRYQPETQTEAELQSAYEQLEQNVAGSLNIQAGQRQRMQHPRTEANGD